MIRWLLLVSLFCICTQDNVEFHCEPQNLTLTTSDQTILSKWEDDPSCFAVLDGLIYELQIFIADDKVHHEELAVMPDQMGYTKSWNWTSYLALECAPHTVRLRARYNSLTSQWKEQTLPETEISNKPEVFPQDRFFKVGSKMTFCCIVPKGGDSPKMFLREYNDSNMNITKISSQAYTLTVDLNQASPNSGTDVICETTQDRNGACAYIGYAPFDSDLQCETRNLHSVECQWKVGDAHLIRRNQPTYHLEGQQCENKHLGKCEAKVQVDAGERNWTLTAQNYIGKVELADRADLMKRVHMLAPVGLKASAIHARNVSVQWRWTVQQYHHLNITCQLNVSYGEINEIIQDFGVGLQFVVLINLIPHWTYNVTVRCGAVQHFWKWSDWSTSVTFLTKGDVPDALDVWMQVRDQVLVIWKTPLTNQSNGHIEDYEVTWVKTRERGQEARKTVQSQHSLALSLDPMEEYTVTVTARNVNGSSPPSVIVIPSLSSEFSEKQKRVKSSWITSSNGSFSLSWSASPAASCGYVVDWYPTTGPCIVDWLKVLPNQTTATIYSKNFREGVRYVLSVYACTPHAPVLLQRREGYVREKKAEDGLFKSLKPNQQDSAVEVSWDPINLREQPAVIHGYVLYCLSSNDRIITRVSTGNVDATSLTVKNLNFTSYKFEMKAQTALGECGATSITVTLNPLTDMLVKSALISLATIFVLLSIVITVCYRHRACIKQKVCPPIPKPVLAEEWLTSLNGRNHLHMPPHHHSEADVLCVSAVNCNSSVLESSYISIENVQFPLSHSPKDYYSQPLMKFTPPPFTSSSTTLQSEIPSSPLRSVFANLTYNLIMQNGHRQPMSGPEFQDTSSLVSSFSDYQPQSNLEWSTDNLKPDGSHSPLTCVSAYVMLPQSNDKSCDENQRPQGVGQ